MDAQDAEQVHQPKPKAVARPIVEVSPNASISPVDAQNAEQVHQPKPKAVARPIVEVSPNASISPVDAQNAEPVREPLPKPVARPIVEVVAGIPHWMRGCGTGPQSEAEGRRASYRRGVS